MADFTNENCIEWLNGQSTATISFSQKKYISKIKKYAQDHPECQIVYENTDGSIVAHIPASWVKVSPNRKGREFTEEEKEAARVRLAEARERKRESNNER